AEYIFGGKRGDETLSPLRTFRHFLRDHANGSPLLRSAHVRALDHRRLLVERCEIRVAVAPETALIETHAGIADDREAVDDVHPVDDLAEHREIELRCREV